MIGPRRSSTTPTAREGRRGHGLSGWKAHNSMMRELGGVFGVAVAAAVFAGAGSFVSPDAFLDGFAPAVVVPAAFSLASTIVALAVPGRSRTGESVPVSSVPALEGA